MKKIATLCLLVSIAAVAMTLASHSSARQSDAFQAFWDKFKTAVTSSDYDGAATLSRFPIGMSYGVRSIRNSVEFRKRHREIFNTQSNAAKCFAAKSPERDSTNPRKYSVACPDAAGNEVVVYEFERTAAGWRFVRLDNLNE